MLRRLLNLFGSPVNRARMAAWAAKVDRILQDSPGTVEGFSAESVARDAQADFSRFNNWEIVCEEVLDTTNSRVYFERAREELRRRGISDEEYTEMRRFAWLTAGWLNFEMLLWEWCHLDERDIHRAIDWQYTGGWISRTERDRRREFANRYDVRMINHWRRRVSDVP
jgi:hypothetical protein